MQFVGRVATVVVLLGAAAAAAAYVIADGGETGAPADRPSAAREPTPDSRPREEGGPQTLVIRRRGGVPRSWPRRLGSLPGVTAVARTDRSGALVRRTRDARGRTVDAPPRGYALALDALVIRPRSYAQVLPSSARATVRRLRAGAVLLSRTSARLRRVGAGGRITLADGRTLRVIGVVDDDLVRGAELAIVPRDVRAAGSRSSQLVVATTQPRRLLRALPRSRTLRVRPFIGGGRPARGGIARPVELKARFGEFAVRLPYGEDWIGIEPGWLRRNIVTRSVPILGPVTCNRRFFAPLRRALGELERLGLARLVDRGDYAGCYAPRRIPGSGSLSLHAWGLAIDLNASSNPQYGASRNDPRLVRAMERAGFTWGGRWPTAPDPMHFELQAPAER